MVIRALCLGLVLLAGPVSPWMAAPCCHRDDACCAGEAPSCPVMPDGECSIAAAGQALATVSPVIGQSQPAPLQAVVRAPEASPLRLRPVLDAHTDPSPPRYLVLRSLRN